MDAHLPSSQRAEALATLERLDFATAVEAARSVIDDPDEKLRFRAAWILADGGESLGKSSLREMAVNRKSELTVPILALGRLRDEGSHALLRDLLHQQLTLGEEVDSRRVSRLGRAMSLISALANYEDAADAALLAEAVRTFYDPTNWIIVDALGRTGGSDAIPTLQDLFTKTPDGATHSAAGLGLSRCGSAVGRDFVSNALRFSSADAPKAENASPGEATEFVLSNLGVRRDEAQIPDLIRIVQTSTTANRQRAQAWEALLHIDSPKQRAEVLTLAWKDLRYRAAARIIAVYDSARALAFVNSGDATYETALLKDALAASERERRRWRESPSYAF